MNSRPTGASRRFAIRDSRPAFTLAELVVSVGVLALVLLTAGQVFTITLGSTGKARALTEANHAIRTLEEGLRRELAAVDRRKSLLVIQANEVNAYWTKKDAESDSDGGINAADGGYDFPRDPERELVGVAPPQLQLPRADMLGFITQLKGQSTSGTGESASTQWIVYGHAALGEINRSATGTGDPNFWQVAPEAFPGYTGSPLAMDNVTFFRTPAEQWHLARRAVLIVSTPDPGGPMYAGNLTDAALLTSEFDTVSTAKPGGGVNGYLYADNYTLYSTNFVGAWELQPSWFARSQIDPTPPPAFASLLGHYMMPGCCSFKVEWTFDVRGFDPALASETEIYWFDPGQSLAGDTLGRLTAAAAETPGTLRESALLDLRDGNVSVTNFLAQRFGATGELDRWGTIQPIPVAGQPTFYDLDPYLATTDPTLDDPDPFFPTALRITVDVMDAQGRFDRPLRHVMILPVGG